MPDHLVRGRRAVRHEKAVIGIEDPRCIPLRSRNRTRVIQQLSQFLDRVTDVGP